MHIISTRYVYLIFEFISAIESIPLVVLGKVE